MKFFSEKTTFVAGNSLFSVNLGVKFKLWTSIFSLSAGTFSLCCVGSDAGELMSLLSAGQTDDVIKQLMSWLHQAESYLSETQPVFGDLDTVSRLFDEHQVCSIATLSFCCTSLSVPARCYCNISFQFLCTGCHEGHLTCKNTAITVFGRLQTQPWVTLENGSLKKAHECGPCCRLDSITLAVYTIDFLFAWFFCKKIFYSSWIFISAKVNVVNIGGN